MTRFINIVATCRQAELACSIMESDRIIETSETLLLRILLVDHRDRCANLHELQRAD